MAGDISNGDIYQVLLNISKDIGEIKGTASATVATLHAHIEDDKNMAEAIQKLNLAQARQRGFVAAISVIGAIAGAGLGAAVDYFSRGGH
jgi:hypothetical protein